MLNSVGFHLIRPHLMGFIKNYFVGFFLSPIWFEVHYLSTAPDLVPVSPDIPDVPDVSPVSPALSSAPTSCNWVSPDRESFTHFYYLVLFVENN